MLVGRLVGMLVGGGEIGSFGVGIIDEVGADVVGVELGDAVVGVKEGDADTVGGEVDAEVGLNVQSHPSRRFSSNELEPLGSRSALRF